VKRLLEIQREQEAIRAKLEEIANMPDPEGDEVTRAKALDDRGQETDDLLAAWDELEAERKPLAERHDRLEAVRAKAHDPANLESGDGSTIRRGGGDGERERYLGGRGPEVMRRGDPYADLNGVEVGMVPPTEVVARAKTAVEQAPEHMVDDAREQVTRLLDLGNKQSPLIGRHMLMTGSERYHQEFQEYVRTRYVGEALRAAMSLTDANGGYLVPFTLDPTIILTNSGITDPIRQISTVKTIATDSWNGVSSAGVTAEWLGEGVEAADASPTFTQPTITPKKAAAWVFGSYEVLADSGFASELSRLLADAKMRLEGAAFATGNTGATRPRGIVAATAAVTASIVTAATTNAFVAGDVYRVADALRPRDAAQASWIANKRIYSLIRQMDTAGGSAFWANLGMGVPAQLLGQPQYEASTMSSVVTTGGNVLLAGNFANYVIVDRVGMSIMYDPLVKSTGNGRPTGQAGWFAVWRVGADTVDPDSFRLLQLNQVAAATALA
jgi:HK97 family phage major capsid protein